MSDWLGLLENGYTPEEINRLLPKISETLGVPLSCLWNEYNVADGFCGDSEIGIIIDQKLYELPLDVQDALYEHGVGVERVQEIYLGEIEAEGSLLTTSRLFQEGCNSCAVD